MLSTVGARFSSSSHLVYIGVAGGSLRGVEAAGA
jgi:hypothetical protein